MRKVYFISGLGADSRSFGFLDLSFCNPQFIQWAVPSSTETLTSYAHKLFHSINNEEAIVVGLSFGGMLATEIAKSYPKTKAIIISSSKTFREIPAYLRMWRYLPLYRLHSDKLKKHSGKLVLKIIGTKGAAQRKVQQQILSESNPAFTRWAIDAIVKWKNAIVPDNLIHIHGTADKLLPYKYVKPHYTIANGEHTMIMDKADELSSLLKKLITL